MNVGGDWHESKRGEGGKNCRQKKVPQPHFRFPPPFLGVQKNLFFCTPSLPPVCEVTVGHCRTKRREEEEEEEEHKRAFFFI